MVQIHLNVTSCVQWLTNASNNKELSREVFREKTSETCYGADLLSADLNICSAIVSEVYDDVLL